MESLSPAPVVTKRQSEPTVRKTQGSHGRIERVLEILIQFETVLLGT